MLSNKSERFESLLRGVGTGNLASEAVKSPQRLQKGLKTNCLNGVLEQKLPSKTMLPQEVVASSSLDTFKRCLEIVLDNWL